LITPVLNLCVKVTDGLIQEGFAVNTRVEEGREGSGGGQVTRGGEFGGLDAAEAVGAGGWVLSIVVKEVENPA